MSTHPRVVAVAAGAPLEVQQVPTTTPKDNQVKVRVEWTASTPLDMHQAIGGLMLNPPQGLGDGIAGTVVEAGPDARHKVGDKVFGFTWRNNEEKAYQLYAVTDDNLVGKLPAGFTMQQAVTLPNNFVTVWHTLTHEFGFDLPWPKPENYSPPQANDWILIWGGASSVGQFAIQILKWYGYQHVITTAGKQHHDRLKRYGAIECFDYRSADVARSISDFIAQHGRGSIKYALDCIGSLDGSMRPIAKILEAGSTAAILLPVIVVDSADAHKPVYSFDVTENIEWKQGVKTSGVRTHFYGDNVFLKEKLQSEIMPKALELGIVEPNDQMIVEGSTLLERAQKALDILRSRGVSGARLVWRVAEEGEQ